jgi:hypothetical protein
MILAMGVKILYTIKAHENEGTGMAGSRGLLAFLVGMLAVISAVSFSGGETRSKFSDGGSSALLRFPEGGGELSNLSVTLPRASTISAATVDIEGRSALYGPTSHAIDFLSPAGSRAWAGTMASVPPAGAPSSYESTNITLQPGIQKSDEVRYTTNGVNMAPYHLFEFYLGPQILSSFSLTWEGIGFSDAQIGIGNNGASLYIWNNATGGWDFQQKDGFGEVPQEVTLKSVATCATSYIDSNGFLNAMVYPAKMYQNRVETDYVKLDYDGYRTIWPADAGIDVGADGSMEWSHPGKLQGKTTFSGIAFVAALQKALNASSTENVTIPLKLNVSAGGTLFISNLSITFTGRNLPPVVKKSLPSVLTVPEDTSRQDVLDLREYFDDDAGAGNLIFNASWISDPGKARFDVDEASLDITAILQDWNGNIKARIRATDSGGLWVESANFTVIVSPVNDPPRFEKSGALNATQGVLFEKTFNVTDPDDIALVFATNATFLYLDEATGTITFLPENRDVGKHLFWVNVTDDEGASDRLNLSLTVQNVNDPPVLQLIPDVSVPERTPFTLKVNASDPDLDIGQDKLRFSSSSDLFNITAAGVISFTPQGKDVGEHAANVTVTDSGGLSDSRSFTITVSDVNDPPKIERPADMTVPERQMVSFRVNASDPDIGDVLTFKSTTSLLTISPDGWANFTPTAKNIGVNTVKITVTDRGGLNASVEFKISVTNVNDPPRNVKMLSPVNGTTFKEGEKMELSASAVDDDGDELGFHWFADGEPIGVGKNLTAVGLKPGKHALKVEASDGTASNSSSPVEILVMKKPQARGAIPMAGPGISALAAAVALLVRGWKKRGSRIAGEPGIRGATNGG